MTDRKKRSYFKFAPPPRVSVCGFEWSVNATELTRGEGGQGGPNKEPPRATQVVRASSHSVGAFGGGSRC